MRGTGRALNTPPASLAGTGEGRRSDTVDQDEEASVRLGRRRGLGHLGNSG